MCRYIVVFIWNELKARKNRGGISYVFVSPTSKLPIFIILLYESPLMLLSSFVIIVRFNPVPTPVFFS